MQSQWLSTREPLYSPESAKRKTRTALRQRAFLAACAFAGWLPPPLKLPPTLKLWRDETARQAGRRDKLGEGNQRSGTSETRNADKLKMRIADRNYGGG